jgi:hypothetical protein
MDLSTIEQVVSIGAGTVSIAAAAMAFNERRRRGRGEDRSSLQRLGQDLRPLVGKQSTRRVPYGSEQ